MQDNHTETRCCHEHYQGQIKPKIKWSFSLVFILTAVFLIKPFLVTQIVSRAEAYTTYGLYKDAVRQYHKALFIDSKNSDVWNRLGNSYKSLGTLSDATTAYHAAIEIDSKNRLALFNLGMILMLKKDYQNAMPYFERVARLGPEDAEYLAVYRFSQHKSSMEMLALCHQRLGQNEEAKKLLEELLRIYPNCISAQERLLQLNKNELQ
jgi:tetratricopeptide (TPR) repeat protein